MGPAMARRGSLVLPPLAFADASLGHGDAAGNAGTAAARGEQEAGSTSKKGRRASSTAVELRAAVEASHQEPGGMTAPQRRRSVQLLSSGVAGRLARMHGSASVADEHGKRRRKSMVRLDDSVWNGAGGNGAAAKAKRPSKTAMGGRRGSSGLEKGSSGMNVTVSKRSMDMSDMETGSRRLSVGAAAGLPIAARVGGGAAASAYYLRASLGLPSEASKHDFLSGSLNMVESNVRRRSDPSAAMIGGSAVGLGIAAIPVNPRARRRSALAQLRADDEERKRQKLAAAAPPRRKADKRRNVALAAKHEPLRPVKTASAGSAKHPTAKATPTPQRSPQPSPQPGSAEQQTPPTVVRVARRMSPWQKLMAKASACFRSWSASHAGAAAKLAAAKKAAFGEGLPPAPSESSDDSEDDAGSAHHPRVATEAGGARASKRVHEHGKSRRASTERSPAAGKAAPAAVTAAAMGRRRSAVVHSSRVEGTGAHHRRHSAVAMGDRSAARSTTRRQN